MQIFFEGAFPGIKSLDELDIHLGFLKETDPAQYKEMMDAARQWTDTAIRNATTNTPIKASLARIHATRSEINQAWADTYYTLWHFFAGWGWNKLVGFKEIASAGFGNFAKGRIGANYLDNLLSLKLSPAEAHAKMFTAYLENESFIHIMNRFYTALTLGKYLDRTSEGRDAAENESLWKDFKDMWRYTMFFSGNLAALESIPEFKVIKAMFIMFSGMLENDVDPITGIF